MLCEDVKWSLVRLTRRRHGANGKVGGIVSHSCISVIQYLHLAPHSEVHAILREHDMILRTSRKLGHVRKQALLYKYAGEPMDDTNDLLSEPAASTVHIPSPRSTISNCCESIGTIKGRRQQHILPSGAEILLVRMTHHKRL